MSRAAPRAAGNPYRYLEQDRTSTHGHAPRHCCLLLCSVAAALCQGFQESRGILCISHGGIKSLPWRGKLPSKEIFDEPRLHPGVARRSQAMGHNPRASTATVRWRRIVTAEPRGARHDLLGASNNQTGLGMCSLAGYSGPTVEKSTAASDGLLARR
ncbi:hypothetical protein F5Y16DRAFT_104271 [Xylariaceae sp. FL0255]|nr:hypothetical protein F5Y16DRAFT_104271 [Xylariaceae sp. FL0255]